MTEASARQFILTFLSAVLALLVLWLAIFYVLDPMQIFHPSPLWRDRYIRNARYQNAGLVNQKLLRDDCCDTAILGTSMSQNFRASTAQQILGGRGVLQLTMSGAAPSELQLVLDRILPTHRITKIVLDVHRFFATDTLSTLHADKRDIPSSDHYFPAFLYDNARWNDLRYLLSLDAFNQIVLQQKGQHYDDMSLWYPFALQKFGQSGKIWQGVSYLVPKQLSARPPEDFPNITQILVPEIRAHPDVTFLLFLPPYSTLFFATASNDEFNRLLQMRVVLAWETAGLPNVKIFAFDADPGRTDLNRYKDIAHYDLATNETILHAMANGTNRLTAANVATLNAALTDTVNRFIAKEKPLHPNLKPAPPAVGPDDDDDKGDD